MLKIRGFQKTSAPYEYCGTCPFCGKEKHLYYNARKRLFFCHRCNERGTAEKLFAKLGIAISQDNLLERLNPVRRKAEVKIIPQQLPEYMREITHKDKEILKFLEKRKLTLSDVRLYNLRYCYAGYYEKRIIVPVVKSFGSNSIPVVFVARAVGKSLRKILYPRGFKIKQLLFGYDDVTGDYCILTESVFDAMFIGRNAVACFGTSLSEPQRGLILEKFRRVYIFFDMDAYPYKVQKIADSLKGYVEVYICIPEKSKVYQHEREGILEYILQRSLRYDEIGSLKWKMK